MIAKRENNDKPQVGTSSTQSYSRPSLFSRNTTRRVIQTFPDWRNQIIGYLCVPILVMLSVTITREINFALPNPLFPGSIMTLFLAIVALIWGTGPTLLMVILGYFSIDYFVITHNNEFRVTFWPDILEILPFMLTGMLIAVFTKQLERNKRAIQTYAAQLETTNNELTREHQTKDRFLSMVSHELKTPVTAIRGHVQLLTNRLTKKSLAMLKTTIFASLNKIEAQTTRLTNLINELQDVGRIQSSEIQINRQPCEIGEICRQTVEEQHLISEREIKLRLPTDPLEVNADRDRLFQVMTNLVSNALKYSPATTPVEIEARKHGNTVRIQVRDYGQGIHEDHLPHIFDLFYRTPGAQSNKISGLGLGLAIVKGIVETHEGRIWCESQPGQGSTFFVELPLSHS